MVTFHGTGTTVTYGNAVWTPVTSASSSFTWHDDGDTCTSCSDWGYTRASKARTKWYTSNCQTYEWTAESASTTATYYDLTSVADFARQVARVNWNTVNWNAVPYSDGEAVRPQTPQERLREILQSRHAPAVISNTKPVGHTTDIREIRARETLRRVIGDDKYQNFLRTGWVNVRARSGRIYQIYPGHGITRVFEKGQCVERLCVVLDGQFPPTDSLIIRYLLILNNEQMFRSKAVQHSVPSPTIRSIIKVEPRPLVDIAREIKGRLAKVG